MDRYGRFQEIRDSLSDWQSLDRPRAWSGNSWKQGPCRNEPELLNPSSRHSSKLGPSGGMTCPAILAYHDDDIAMFDVPPPLRSRGLAEYKKTWDLFFAYHHPRKPSTSKSYKCASATPSLLPLPSCVAGSFQFRLTIGLCKVDGAWRIPHEHHSVPATD
jgi:ketosteroid isomerase-like protein